jgi:hypothetical protein
MAIRRERPRARPIRVAIEQQFSGRVRREGNGPVCLMRGATNCLSHPTSYLVLIEREIALHEDAAASHGHAVRTLVCRISAP